MRRTPSLKLRAYLLLTAILSLAALASGRPELVAIAAPFAVYVAVGLGFGSIPEVELSAEPERERVLEGEEVTVRVRVSAADEDIELLELELRPRAELSALGPARRALRLRAGERREARFSVRADRWGGFRVGLVLARARDRFGLIDTGLAPVQIGPLRVFPRLETLRSVIDPSELQATTGSRVARDRGEGIEFAEIRPFVPGDRVRRVNWRATARRGVPYVSERHPERNADVILFLDTFSEVRDEAGSTLTLAVRAAAALAAVYLARKDRVGVIGFGGVLHGLGPRLGNAQLYRILDALIGSEVVFSYAHKDVSFVPRQLLPAKALLIAISPLIDDRSIGALLDLRARGFDVAVLDVSPLPFAPTPGSESDAVAHRLWVLKRETLRTQLEQLGVAVSEWRDGEPLQLPVARVSAFRRGRRKRVAA
jgi:uncharacterized protein (DUF58 family)